MSNSVCLDNTLLVIHVEVEGTVADLQPEGIEGCPTYEQVNVLGRWLTLGDAFGKTAVSTAYLHSVWHSKDADYPNRDKPDHPHPSRR